MKRVAIIGGGIAGLSAAFYLEQSRAKGAALNYAIFESNSRLGGAIFTEHVDGCIVEGGPDSFLTEKPWALQLCRDLGIESHVIGSNDAERKTFILTNGKLVVIPDGLMFMVPTKLVPAAMSPLFSWGTKLRMAREYFMRPEKYTVDESVGSLVERHLGREVVERLVDPLLTGVYGGDAYKLSARAVLPRFVEMEAQYGSLTRGMLAARHKMAAKANGAPRTLFTSLKDGMHQMVDAILGRLAFESLRLGTRVAELRREGAAWSVVPEHGNPETFDDVIIATPAYVAASLVHDADPALGAELRQIPYSSSVTVTLGYDAYEVRDVNLDGFGYLVPRAENRRMLACTFVHHKFPFRAPDGRVLLRCFLGGARDEAVLSVPDDELLRIVRGELQEILGLSAEPRFSRTYRWPRAMAQYEVGHVDRVERIERMRKKMPGLHLVGNAYRGIGVPDCVRGGMEAAKEIVPST